MEPIPLTIGFLIACLGCGLYGVMNSYLKRDRVKISSFLFLTLFMFGLVFLPVFVGNAKPLTWKLAKIENTYAYDIGKGMERGFVRNESSANSLLKEEVYPAAVPFKTGIGVVFDCIIWVNSHTGETIDGFRL